jgi:hypothetical protein
MIEGKSMSVPFSQTPPAGPETTPMAAVRQSKLIAGHRLRTTALCIAAMALCACQPSVTAPTTSDAVTSAPEIKVSANATPGTNPISAARARSVFAALCITSKGARPATEAAAAADGFVKHASYGTYYHPRDNLSVKLIDGDCSMVFASTASPTELEKALVSLTSGSPAVRFAASPLPDETPYYNARIAVR